MENSQPFVSVVIPVKDLSYYLLFENLPAFTDQTYKEFEVLLLPNQYSQYDLTLLRNYKWLKIIASGKITRPAQKRNLGVEKARGTLIAFIDDDAYPEKHWVESAVKSFQAKAGAVCGPGILPKNSNRWEKIFDEVLKTWIGSGGYAYRFMSQKPRFVDDYPSMNFFIRKKLFVAVGCFKMDFWPGEDSKLCEDIVYKKKKKILYNPKIIVYHHRRNNLKGFLAQHANYGFHRGAFFAHADKNSRRVIYLLPTLFVTYFFFLILFHFLFSLCFAFKVPCSMLYDLRFLFYVPITVYLSFCLYLFVKALINSKDLIIVTASPFVLFLTHIIYGIMFVKGLIKGYLRKQNIYD